MTYAEYQTESLKILSEARKYLLNDFDKFQVEMAKLDKLCEAYKKDMLDGKISPRDSRMTYSLRGRDGRYRAVGLCYVEAEDYLYNSSVSDDLEVCPDGMEVVS